MFKLRYAQLEEIYGWLFVTPWLFGFLAFIVGPMLVSVYLAFTNWDILTPAQMVGFDNFVKLTTGDPLVGQALKVTTIYAGVSIPLQVVLGLILALLLNEKIKAMSFVRTVFYLPSVVAGVAVALLWRWIFSPDFGLLNAGLDLVGIDGPAWLADSRTALSALILMSLWGVGGGMLIVLAGLQGVPTTLYEAAEVDGANSWVRFWNVTLPMISPVILFQTVMGIIGGLAGVYRSLRDDRGRAQVRHPVLHAVPVPERLRIPQDGVRLGSGLGTVCVHPAADPVGPAVLRGLGLL